MVFIGMRFVILLLAFSLFMSGYCAAAHAFGEIPMQDKGNNSVMADMPDCPGMKMEAPTKKDSQHPTKVASMNCKACCALLVGFLEHRATDHFTLGATKFPLSDHMMRSDFRVRIFHPPKSPV